MHLYVLLIAGFLMVGGTPSPRADVMGIFVKEAECLAAKAELDKAMTPENVGPQITALGVACVKVQVKAMVPTESKVKA